MTRYLLSIPILVGLLIGPVLAAPLSPEDVPDPLKPWRGWVLWNDKNQTCPDLAGSSADRPCTWPSSLSLKLDTHGGQFELRVQVFADQRLILPGDAEHWPQTVKSGDQPIAVTQTDERPVVWLKPGFHTLSGHFFWDRLPAVLSIPPRLALIDLEVDRQPVAFPALNEQGQLWLRVEDDEQRPGRSEDTLKLTVFRRLNDGVPMRVVTHADLDIAGRPRELTLRGAALPNTLPMRLDSPLPARLEPDGNLRLQARPGHWSLELLSRFTGETADIRLPDATLPWPGEEIWAFLADPSVRLAEIREAPAIDPRQTELPEDWKNLPAYRLAAGGLFHLETLRRGDPLPEPDRLNLRRTLWLDFDGQGFTVNDRIGGRMTRGWRLEAGDGMSLGRVSIDGEPQSITRAADKGGIGVEVRRGQLNLSGDSRLPNHGALSATGWRKDFQSVSAELNLPPGWRLFAALGVDEAGGAWLDGWTLLDFFLVLTLTLAVGRLWDWRAGAVTLATLALIWHEPGAPRYVWLNLLAATALLRVVPVGTPGEPHPGQRAAPWIQAYWRLAALLLIVVAIPFIANQLRLGLYPQLEPRLGYAIATHYLAQQESDLEQKSIAGAIMDEVGEAAPLSRGSLAQRKPRSAAAPSATLPLEEMDPNAITQTGPGLPRWEWQRLSLRWKGPVQAAQTVHLILLSPAVNFALNVLRVILLSGLAVFLIGGGHWPIGRLGPSGGGPMLLALLALFIPDAGAAEFPTPDLLNELRARLAAPPDCHPQCAAIPRMSVATEPDRLTLNLDIDAAIGTGVPLPARIGQWLPSRVELDGQSARALIRTEEGLLWLFLEAGHHRVVLGGPLPTRERVDLPLPLMPHRVEVAGQGWRIEGIGENGVPEVQLRLIRESDELVTDLKPGGEAPPLPAFLEVERTLRLGLEWRAITAVRRLTPADSAVSLSLPLLPGESVLSAEVPVRAGQVTLNLPAGQSEIRWESTLAKQTTLTLTAPRTEQWTEIWRLDASPIWHVASDGIAVAHHQSPIGRWQPEWRPWPGEQVELTITRPLGAPGATLTLDSSDLVLRPGERSTEAILTLSLRSSQGGQQKLMLPDRAVLQTVTLDGVQQPIRQEGSLVTLPIHPGTQTAVLTWLRESGIGTVLRAPEIRPGLPGVNVTTRLELGRDRWVLLLGGPRLGPAVLFWSLFATLLLLAYGLARLSDSPARFWQWALLLIGLSQASLLGGLMVVGWLLGLAWRHKKGDALNARSFRAVQIGLIFLTLAALSVLAGAVAEGLLGLPSMQIAGNRSDAYHLNWYLDRSQEALPRPWVVSVPLWVYRTLMLAWALWLANTLLNWLRWGWGCFTAGRIWSR